MELRLQILTLLFKGLNLLVDIVADRLSLPSIGLSFAKLVFEQFILAFELQRYPLMHVVMPGSDYRADYVIVMK